MVILTLSPQSGANIRIVTSDDRAVPKPLGRNELTRNSAACALIGEGPAPAACLTIASKHVSQASAGAAEQARFSRIQLSEGQPECGIHGNGGGIAVRRALHRTRDSQPEAVPDVELER